MNKVYFILLFFIFPRFCFGQDYILKNEELIFSFKTKNGKQMVLVKDKNDGYIIYRFGTSKKIELEYPEKNKESWAKFTFSHYMRGGGIKNAGMELQSLFFRIDNYDYTLYKDYCAEGEVSETGILVTNLTTQKTIDIKGRFNTIRGNLIDIFESGLILEDIERIR